MVRKTEDCIIFVYLTDNHMLLQYLLYENEMGLRLN